MTTAQGTDILVGVASTKYISGITNLNQRAESLRVLPLSQAVENQWDSDAHLTLYYPTGNHRNMWPRMNKAVLGKVRIAGEDLHTRAFAFDYDNPDHRSWDEYMPVDDWIKWFHEVFVPVCPWAGLYSALYTTKHGARLIYQSNVGIPVDDAENKHRWMVNELNARGLPVDRGCTDWTRLFRLPIVRRDGTLTSTQPYFRLYCDWSRFIDGASIPETGRREGQEYIQNIRDFDEPIPDRAVAEGLLKEYNTRTGRMVMAGWFKKARTRLRNRDCYGPLFRQEVLAEHGQRDTTLYKLVGEAISMLFKMSGISPVHIFAMFLECVDGLEPDDGTPDWHVKLWDHIGRIWVLEEAKRTEREMEDAEKLEEQQDTLDAIIDGMKRWCSHPALHGDKPTAQKFANRHLIVNSGKSHHIMKPDGTYDEMAVDSVSLVARIRILGMDSVIQTERVNENGTITEIENRTLFNKHATIVRGINAMPCINGGRIERIDSGDAELVIPTYERNEDIEPEFQPEVDQWMRYAWQEYYDEMNEWVGWSLAFDEGPICGLSIVAAPGIGKTLLTQGLSECLKIPDHATAHDMVSDYQYGLMTSPFVLVNEGWPKGRWGMHPADAFRMLIDGKSQMVNRKFLAPVKVHNPVRIIFTANNSHVIQMLGAHQDLTPDDRDALTVRLKHLDLEDRQEAAHWLASKGGKAFTGMPGRRWIGGTANEPSDFVVAKHFMWLYSQRGSPVPGRRFLVDGTANDSLMYEFRTTAGSNPLVIEALLKMIESGNPTFSPTISEDHRLFGTTSQVLDYYQLNMAQTARQTLTIKNISNAFKSICTKAPKNATLVEGKRARWWELDPELLLNVARKDGRPCEKLSSLCQRRAAGGQQ